LTDEREFITPQDVEPQEIQSVTDESDDNVETNERSQILLDAANISFERFLSNIDKINTKILSMFQIFLVIVTIQITLVGFGDKTKLSCINYLFLSWIVILAIFTFFYFSYLLWPKTYEHVEIFNEERFNELCSFPKEGLLSDLLYHTRKAHLSNIENYKMLGFGLKVSIFLIFLNLIFFSIFSIMFFLK
jgi:hypothetical protein